MGKYRITIKRSAAKELGDVPKKDLQKIVKRIRSLAENPRPHGSQKLSHKEQYRIRQGDFRIVYSIEDEDSLIDIFKIGHSSWQSLSRLGRLATASFAKTRAKTGKP